MNNNSKWISLLLDSNGFIVINKALIKAFGVNAAIMIGELVSEYNYYEKTEKLIENEWFFSTQTNIQENTGLSRHSQEESIKKLTDLGLIETKLMGMPSRKYYKIIFENLENVLKNAEKPQKLKVVKSDKQGCQILQTSLSNMTNKDAKSDKQGCQILQTSLSNMTTNNNNNNNKTIINNSLIYPDLDIPCVSEEEKDLDKFDDFKKRIDLDNFVLKYPEINLNGILSIIKDLYRLTPQEYIKISGKKVYGKEIREVLNSFDPEMFKETVLAICNKINNVANIKAYIIAAFYNAPKTIELHKMQAGNSHLDQLQKHKFNKRKIALERDSIDYDKLVDESFKIYGFG